MRCYRRGIVPIATLAAELFLTASLNQIVSLYQQESEVKERAKLERVVGLERSEMLNKLERERTTLQMMLKHYCKVHHHSGRVLCPECQGLSDYALTRLASCKFGENKPTCGKCTVHCYKPEMRKRIIEIMRYSGPRMLFIHPVIAIRHLIDGLKKVN